MASSIPSEHSKRLSSQAIDSGPAKKKFADVFKKRIHKEEQKLTEHANDPLYWGPYLAERQWGTIREDYSPNGSCWDYLTYLEATKQAYHWGEDGLLGICDKFGMLCASLALWNKKDPVLKERLFGLTGREGNHGEDVKELYYYLDNTPKHNYMRALYRYPQAPFPYEQLINHNRTPSEPELEIMDTGVFDEHDYWDISIEYAKPVSRTIICRITVFNHSSQRASLDLIPQFYFRNTWSKVGPGKSEAIPVFHSSDKDTIDAVYEMGIFKIKFLYKTNVTLRQILYTDNDSAKDTFEEEEEAGDPHSPHPHSGVKLLTGSGLPSASRLASGRIVSAGQSTVTMASTTAPVFQTCKKDAFHQYIINGDTQAVSPVQRGTKSCAWMTVDLEGNTKTCVYWQIFPASDIGEQTIDRMDTVFATQINKAKDFYMKVIPRSCNKEEVNVCRQAVAGLLWSKQLYIYNMELKNKELLRLFQDSYFRTSFGKKKLGWNHLSCHDILLMPDKWEFPWFAAWDLAFHCVQFSRLDMPFAKEQILLLMSDRYMHPNGQIPGCEFDLGDTNPPILAWAVWKMYRVEGVRDVAFLKTCFNRLIFSFQWWHKKDPRSVYLYGHGFMGLDNISVFDRSHLPAGINVLKQADCTGWMGLFTLHMLQITIELCKHDSSYTDMAIKFLKHFLFIAKAINRSISDGGLWDEEDKFFYDVIYYHDPHKTPIRLRSWTGIIPLLACCTINLKHSPLVKAFLLKSDRGFSPYVCKLGEDEFFLTLVSYTKLKMMLKMIFSEQEFLSPFGIRSLSKIYEKQPFTFEVNGVTLSVSYLAGESDTDMFGGNSNWRGPIWLCMNYLFVECLERYADLDKVFTLPLSIQYPTGQATKSTFLTIAQDLCRRMVKLFMPDQLGLRPVHGRHVKYANDSDWDHMVLFYEYFNAETGEGCGGSHQTGWSALVLEFIHKLHGTPRASMS